jgi:nicotinamidase-related amidase
MIANNMSSNTTQAHTAHAIFIDLQTKLIPAMDQTEIASVIKQCGILAQAAALLDVPTTFTQQYTKALGETVPELSQFLAEPKTSANAPIEKISFSAMGEPKFRHQLVKERRQIILVGIEAHICVLQTALGLLKAGKEVFVVEDAICSRNPANKANAIERMRAAGCVITNTESVVFEWLGKAGGEPFKTISKLIR